MGLGNIWLGLRLPCRKIAGSLPNPWLYLWHVGYTYYPRRLGVLVNSLKKFIDQIIPFILFNSMIRKFLQLLMRKVWKFLDWIWISLSFETALAVADCQGQAWISSSRSICLSGWKGWTRAIIWLCWTGWSVVSWNGWSCWVCWISWSEIHLHVGCDWRLQQLNHFSPFCFCIFSIPWASVTLYF